MSNGEQDHDQRFKQAVREFFPDFLRLAQPDRADAFDCTALEWLDQEQFLDPPQGQRVLLDMVARLNLTRPAAGQRAGPWLVLVNVEVESEDRIAHLRERIYRYWHVLRVRYGLPVLSLGLFLRVGLAGLGVDVYTETFLDEPVLTFRYPYVGLPGLEAFDYLNGDNLLAVALTALMHCPRDRRAELKAGAMERVATATINEMRRYLLAEIIEAYMPMEEPDIQQYEHLLRTEPYKEARTVTMTVLERERQAAAKRTAIEILRPFLEDRFGILSPEVLQRLEALPITELTTFPVRLRTAQSLRDLGLAD
jgi:hypothetical protein